MASGQSKHGVGSNQYAVRSASSALEADLADRLRMAEAVPVRSSSHDDVTGEALSNQPISALVADLSVAKEESLKAHGLQFDKNGIIVGRGGPQASEQQIVELARSQASHEDAILQRHQDFYGQATVDAVDWHLKLAASPSLRRELDDPESNVSRLTDDYVTLLSDMEATPGENMGVDDMAELLLSIQTNPERDQCSDDSDELVSEEGRRQRLRHTALSLACSRSSNSEERAQLIQERDRVEQMLNQGYTDELGLNAIPSQLR